MKGGLENMLKKKFALVLVMLMVFSTFSVSMAGEGDVPVELPIKLVDADGNLTDEDFEEVDGWPLELYEKIDGKYVQIGLFESGTTVDLEDGMYKVKEMKMDGYLPYGPDEYEIEVLDSVVTYYLDDDEFTDELVFKNVGPFEMVEGFWAIPGEFDVDEFDEDTFVIDEDTFTAFGKSWGGFFEFDPEGEPVPLVGGQTIDVGTVEFSSTTATFQLNVATGTMQYQLLEYHIHVTEEFVDDKDNGKKQVKDHKDDTQSARPGQFNDKSDGFAGFEDEVLITVPEVEEEVVLFVAVHGEVGVPGGDAFNPEDFEENFAFFDEVIQTDVVEMFPEDPHERGNKFGHEDVEKPEDPKERGNKFGHYK